MNRSTPGLPVDRLFPEFTQTQVHRVGDAIQPFHPLLSPFPPARNPSQHQITLQRVLLSLTLHVYLCFLLKFKLLIAGRSSV